MTSTLGPALGCRFAGATDDVLFCDAPGSPDGTGYRFERATVIGVEYERQRRDWHPAWIAATVFGGVLTGLAAAQGTDAGHAALAGMLGGVMVGIVGAPLAFSEPSPDAVRVVLRPYMFRFQGRRLVGLRPAVMR